MQMANCASIMANRGFYYVPHLVRSIGQNQEILPQYKVKHNTSVDTSQFAKVIAGMANVTKPGGTAWGTGIPGIEICGKTGTAQNPHGKDHSLFIAFAPKDHPKIAIAVIVENGGFGATWAAPIANLMIEHYMNKGKPSAAQSLLDQMLKGIIAQ
jgi:penicillin-binding protein 2